MIAPPEFIAHHIDEFGVAVKGWDLHLEGAAQAACFAYGEYCDPELEQCVWLTYGIAEVWIRRRPAVETDEYSEIFDVAKPGSRGAGKFTVFYWDVNPYEVHRQIQTGRIRATN